MTLLSFNTLPQFNLYWSADEDMCCLLVRELRSCSYFQKVKGYFQVCGNNICADDKLTKLRPLFSLVNQKLIQFGVFTEHVNIDNQMIRYFWCHSCKMFIRGKPICFRYNNGVLCSDDGYQFKVTPYQGKSINSNQGPLGFRIFKGVFEVVNDDK